MLHINNNPNKLSNLQLELLKSLNYVASEKQLNEIRSLLRFYFAEQLDKEIEKVETEKNYTAATYQKWLETNAAGTK